MYTERFQIYLLRLHLWDLVVVIPVLQVKELTQALFAQGHRDNKCQNRY